jgi:TonB dependent receptor
MSSSVFVTALLLAASALAGDKEPSAAKTPEPPPAPARAAETPSAPRRRVDASARRNENVAVQQIDNTAIKEAHIRLGDNVTVVPEPPVELNQYASEHGQPAGEALVLRPQQAPSAWHSELFWWHQNSVFNARTFFQVGSVKPSRRNGYGGRFTGGLGRFGNLTANASQTKIRGMVNGNVLAPLAGERSPLTTDPATAAMVQRFFAAYPVDLPNRPDFDPRALNTNAPQHIDETRGDLRWDLATSGAGHLSAFHSLSRQRVDAFQLVAGQNPDSEIHSHRSRLTYRQALSPSTEAVVGFAFNRVRSLLLPEPNAVGPRVRFGFQIEELGPDSHFPINRAQNSFRYGVLLTHQASGGRHSLTFGGDLSRLQLNGIETNNQRGYFQFSNNFGRSAIENLRWGTPTTYEVTVGELSRAFRNWSFNAFAADRWRIHPKVQIYCGLRYNLETAPVEIHGADHIPYRSDGNNFSPRFSIAWNAFSEWMMRTSYTVSFAQIPPVTYQQVRNNPPYVRYLQVQNPDLVNPLRDVNLSDPNLRHSPTWLAGDLVSPYVHQYNFSLERRLPNRSMLRFGYIGSRTIKTINSFILNRANHIPGIESTTGNVDARRPDARYYDVKWIVNGGIAYLDAAQATFEVPQYHGLNWGVTYTFGKAIDEGADYASTAANRDLLTARSQWQYDSFKDKKGLSTFDSTHAALLFYSWDLPRATSNGRWLGKILNGWQVSGATLLKSGTPLTLYLGSDAPGFGNVDGGPSDRPNIVDPSILGATISHPNVAPVILRRDRFAYIRLGDNRGSLGRGTFRKQGIANFNTALTRQWRLSGHREWNAQLRAEAYNLSNHAQFDEPQRNLSSPSFGRITNTLNDGRVMQLSLRFVL